MLQTSDAAAIGDLLTVLQSFQVKVNTNPRVQKLLRGWEPIILVESKDVDDRFYMYMKGSQIAQIERTCPDDVPHFVHLRARRDDLIAIFSGQRNPARAFLDADLECFASDKDQVKLDAIALIIWGL